MPPQKNNPIIKGINITKSTTLAVPYVTPQLFANTVITAMHKLQKRSKSFFTTQGSETEIRADKIILLKFTTIIPYYLISTKGTAPLQPKRLKLFDFDYIRTTHHHLKFSVAYFLSVFFLTSYLSLYF